MRGVILGVTLLFLCGAADLGGAVGGGFMLAGESIPFDAEHHPQFTEHQLSDSSESVRAGLEKWAATKEGQRLIDRFRAAEYEVRVIERADEAGPGRAPQPDLNTMLAAGNRKKLKRYLLILNPTLADEYRSDTAIPLGEPVTPADVMAAAWAAEMLHIDFYSCGIVLPHHDRADFQRRWELVASQLGFPSMRHDSEGEFRSPWFTITRPYAR